MMNDMNHYSVPKVIHYRSLTGVGITVGVKNIKSSDFDIFFLLALKSHPNKGILPSTGIKFVSCPESSLYMPPITTVSPLFTMNLVCTFFPWIFLLCLNLPGEIQMYIFRYVWRDALVRYFSFKSATDRKMRFAHTILLAGLPS